MIDKEERKNRISDAFQEAYGAQPLIWSRAPGRVDLMGSHTDYNMGYVMTMTIDRDTWIAARPRTDRQIRVRSLNIAGESIFTLDQIERGQADDAWSNYVRGMAYVMQAAGHELQGFDGMIHSTVPFGSGLSSSAALEMATAVTFQQLGDFELDPVKMALFGQKAENDYAGVSTGILDQYSSAMGKAGNALQLDCRELTSKDIRIAAELRVVICDTRAERNLVGSEYDDRRDECEEGLRIMQKHDPSVQALRDVSRAQFRAYESQMPPVIARRCRFIIEENQRVLDLAAVLPEYNPEALNDLFTASYDGASDLFEIGAPAMESMMRAMISGPGIVAARQAGAGFGGCMVALVKKDNTRHFCDHVQQTYAAETSIQPRTFAVVASPGAGVLKL